MAAHLGRHMTTMHAQAKPLAISGRGSMSPTQRKVIGVAWKRRKAAEASESIGEFASMSTETLIMTRRSIDRELADRLVRGTG
jgi:hypothetical protein